MSLVLSSMQYIWFRKTSGSNMGARRQTCFLPRPPSNLVAPLMQTCGYPSLSLRFSSYFLVSTKCKAVFAVASFRNSSAKLLKPAWCSNFGKLSDSLVNIVLRLNAWNSFSRVSNFLVFSPLMLFWALIIFLNYSKTYLKKFSKKGY